MIILKKIVVKGIKNRMLRLRARKIEQWEALSVARTDHPSMAARNSDISGFNIGAAKNVTR